MDVKKQVVGALAVSAVAAAALVGAAPANAALTTRCVGEGGAVTVPGDVVVPSGQSCNLSGTTVLGDVRVKEGADLLADGVTIGGRVIADDYSYVEAVDSTIDGQVVLRGAFGGSLESTQVGERVVTRPGAESDAGGFVYTEDAEISTDLISNQGEVFMEASEVGGKINSVESLYTDVYDSFIDGQLTVRDNDLGSIVCTTAVQGGANLVGNDEIVQLGGDTLEACAGGGNYFGDDVKVTGTTGGVYADSNIVNGSLTLRNNDPVAVVGEHNVVRGGIVGDYEEADGSAARLQSRSLAPSSAAVRQQVLEQKIAKRHDTAVKSADRAGSAGIGR